MKTNPTINPRIETLNASEAAQLLGIGRTRFWQLRQQYGLERVAWSNDARPRYRREDVLAMKHGAVPSKPLTDDEAHRLAKEAADYADRGLEWPPRR